jgi:hypothetical protein
MKSRERARSQFEVAELLKESSKERNEQYEAQIAVLSCAISYNSIAQGIENHVRD